jgi:TRAP-type uncharacterized transport system substrate-binding protein
MCYHQSVFLAITAIVLLGCERAPTELRLIMPKMPVSQAIAEDFASLLDRNSAVKITLVRTPEDDITVLEALASGAGDIAIITDIMPFRSDVATVMPLYPTVLHVLYRKGRSADNIEDLLTGATVYAGPPGSSSRILFERIANRNELAEGDFAYSDAADQEPDIIVVFAPISPQRLKSFSDYVLYSMGKPEDIGTGSVVDSTTLLNPQFKAFVIPTGTYGHLTPGPVLTVSVNQVLVARRDLDRAVVYDLASELVSLRPALAALRPGLFREISDDFDPSSSTFIIHPGAQDYSQRDAPTVYERYSGLAEVGITILIALISAVLGGLRIYRVRRKNRIDTFYSEVIAIKNSIDETATAEERSMKSAEVQALKDKAFEMLVDEKLAADESFSIFITLSNDVLRQLGAVRGQTPFPGN